MAIKTTLIQVKAKWAKILGEAPPGYENGPAEWTLDGILDDKAEKEYIASGADPFYIKTNKDGEKFIKFTRKALKKDGTASQPIRVVDSHGEAWDQTKLIGNDSVLNVQFSLNEVNSKGKKRFKPSILAVQVWDFAAYKPKSGFPTKEDSNILADDTKPAWDEA